MSKLVKHGGAGVTTLTKRQNQIFEFRRKGIPAKVIMNTLSIDSDDYKAELEAIKSYNKAVITHHDDDSFVVETITNMDEYEALIWMQIDKIDSPLDKIKAIKEGISARKENVKLRQELGLMKKRVDDSAKKSGVNVNILQNYQGVKAAEQHIEGIVNTTLTTELQEPEPLPDDIELTNAATAAD